MPSLLITLIVAASQPPKPGNHIRSLKVDGKTRSYLVHIPTNHKPERASPIVLVFHGAGMNSSLMVPLCRMNEKADKEGFIAVYPDGTGVGPFRTFNAGGLQGKWAEGRPNDVSFVAAVLDDLARVVKIDHRRVYATGISNGGMMCYRLAAELSNRIAAIAPVSGTMAIEQPKPKRAVPVIHFHGTADRIVPFGGPNKGTPSFLTFKSVSDTIDQ